MNSSGQESLSRYLEQITENLHISENFQVMIDTIEEKYYEALELYPNPLLLNFSPF